MKQKSILDGHGVYKGKMDIGEGIRLFIYDNQGKMMGYYNTQHDKTYNNKGVLIGYGDQRQSLLD